MAYIPSGSPPPGQPPGSGQPPGGSPSTPRKNPRGFRATIYQLKTDIKRAVVGNGSKQKNKAKKGEQEAKTPATAPAPVIVQTHDAQAPIPVLAPIPAMPAPITQNDFNYFGYPYGQPHVYPTLQPPVQHMPLPAIVTTQQQQHPFIASQPPLLHSPPQQSFTLSASQPAMVSGGGKDWNAAASECMADVLDRLERGDPDEVASGFNLLGDVEGKFTGATIDRWIAEALKDYSLEDLEKLHMHAGLLLPTDSLLSAIICLGIERVHVPLKLVKAITDGQHGPVLALANRLRRSCNPAKSGDKKPDEDQATMMMWDMLDKAVAKLADDERHALSQAIFAAPATEMASAVLILHELMKIKY
jgi:hypothetical protein